MNILSYSFKWFYGSSCFYPGSTYDLHTDPKKKPESYKRSFVWWEWQLWENHIVDFVSTIYSSLIVLQERPHRDSESNKYQDKLYKTTKLGQQCRHKLITIELWTKRPFMFLIAIKVEMCDLSVEELSRCLEPTN